MTPRLTRRLLALVALPCFAGLVVLGCASPTLPLPPPARPSVMGPDATGTVSLSGRVPSRTQAFALNHATSIIAGQQTGQSGEYEFQMAASAGDEIEFWYQSGTVDSGSVFFVIGEPTAGAAGAAGAGGE